MGISSVWTNSKFVLQPKGVVVTMENGPGVGAGGWKVGGGGCAVNDGEPLNKARPVHHLFSSGAPLKFSG